LNSSDQEIKTQRYEISPFLSMLYFILKKKIIRRAVSTDALQEAEENQCH
jgi:hypothetical protein